jgi:yecA family protein
MQNLQLDLTEAEQLELFSFYPKHSEESFSLVSLDGFLHGIVCLPALINPTEWIQDVLPESFAQTKANVERVLGLTFRYYNQIATALSGWEAKPCFDGSSEQARIWLEGFGRAFSYDTTALEALSDAEAEELIDEEDENMFYTAIVMTFVLNIEDAPPDEDKDAFLRLKQSTIELLGKGTAEENKDLMVDLLMTVYELLEPARDAQKYKQIKRERFEQGQKMGRNEPCFCGSGKKFKHCHGRPGFKE